MDLPQYNYQSDREYLEKKTKKAKIIKNIRRAKISLITIYG